MSRKSCKLFYKLCAILNIVLFVIVLTPTCSLGGQFKVDRDGFTIDLPPGWIQIPQAIISEREQQVAVLAPKTKIPHYDYGFQFGTRDQWFSYPYILIKIKRTGRITTAEFKKLEKFSYDQTAQKLQKSFGDLIKEAEIGKMRYDPVSQVVWLNTGINISAIGRISGITALIPTEYGFIQMNGYTREQEFMGFVSVFHDLVRNVTLDENVKYQAKPTDSIPLLNTIKWDAVLVAVLTGIILAVIGGFWRKRQTP